MPSRARVLTELGGEASPNYGRHADELDRPGPVVTMMSLVIADISVSLDSFVTGPGADFEHGLGHCAEQLHVWVESDHDVDRSMLRTLLRRPARW